MNEIAPDYIIPTLGNVSPTDDISLMQQQQHTNHTGKNIFAFTNKIIVTINQKHVNFQVANKYIQGEINNYLIRCGYLYSKFSWSISKQSILHPIYDTHRFTSS